MDKRRAEDGAPQPPAVDPLDWNGPTARFWADHDDRFDALLARHGEALVAAAAPGPGHHVLDIGCGCGSMTLCAAAAVASGGGTAIGVDISPAMVDRARYRAAQSGADNARFEVGDMQTADLGAARFDLAISRYGVMFFGDHTAAFANIRSAVRPGGRLAFVCWAERSRNENWTVAFDALAPHLGLAPPVARSNGPFALADPAYVRAVLDRAGWARVQISELLEPLRIGDDADDAVDFELADPDVAEELAAADPPRRRAGGRRPASRVRRARAARWRVAGGRGLAGHGHRLIAVVCTEHDRPRSVTRRLRPADLGIAPRDTAAGPSHSYVRPAPPGPRIGLTMRLLLQVERVGTHYQGSLTRTDDELSVGFDGVLELLAAIERLERPKAADADANADDGDDA